MRFIFVCIFLVYSFTASTVVAQHTQHMGVFPTFIADIKLAKKWEAGMYHFAAINSINPSGSLGNASNSEFLIGYLENSLTYKIKSNFSITGSYVYERLFPAQDIYRNEHRYFIQTTYANEVNQVQFKYRLRMDYRHIEDRIIQDWNFSTRLRYLTGISGTFKKNDRLYWFAYNEFFFNLFQQNGPLYAENWASIALGKKINNTLKGEIGPLSIFWINDFNQRNNLWYVQISLLVGFDFIKKK
jgi:hypothetical protein